MAGSNDHAMLHMMDIMQARSQTFRKGSVELAC